MYAVVTTSLGRSHASVQSSWHGLYDAKERANGLVESGKPWAIVVDEQTGVVLYRAGVPVTQPPIPQNEE